MQFPGPVTNSFSELNITVVGSVAYDRYISDGTVTAKDGSKAHLVVRSTDVLRKANGKWQIVLEHNSVPVDGQGRPALQAVKAYCQVYSEEATNP